MAKVALSYGHGANTYEDKRSKFVIKNGKVYEEHTHNYKVGVKVRDILKDHGVQVLELQPANGTDVSLTTRTNKANSWGADLYWSIHANAGTPAARGWAAFYWGTSKDSKKAAQLYADEVKELGFPLYSGGTYASVKGTWTDFHELRESKMTAVLTENGFMTNPEDFKYIFENKDDYYNKMAIAHAKAILAYFGIKYKGEKSTPAAAKPAATKPAESKPASGKGDMKTSSIVEYLQSIDESSSFSNREKLAEKYGIKNYKGTADQNTTLLEKLRSGAPVASKPVVKGDQKTTSLVDYLKSINEPSSFANREKLAKQYGISGYQGTASQNTKLLEKLRGH